MRTLRSRAAHGDGEHRDVIVAPRSSMCRLIASAGLHQRVARALELERFRE